MIKKQSQKNLKDLLEKEFDTPVQKISELKEDNHTLCNFSMEKSIWKDFKITCTKNDLTASEKIREMIKKYLNENGLTYL